MVENEKFNVPRHVAVIMDGNGRWAKKRLLPRSAGHAAGMKRMISLAEHAKKVGVKYLTVYALSTENLSRPEEELQGLFGLIKKYFAENVARLIKMGATVKVIGDTALLPDDVREAIDRELAHAPKTADFTFVLALCYGARSEIVRAANTAVKEGKLITESKFAGYLYTQGVPDPDFIIRTGGEVRLSNFLLWQAAYAEMYFTKVLFPDFTGREFDRAIEDFRKRVRRFGKV